MFFAGIDIGSLSANSVIISNGKIISWSNIRVGPLVEETARSCLDKALTKPNIKQEELEFIVSTGYGRAAIPFANKHLTEIACHARGAHHLFPDTRTILDMGGQDCKAIRCDNNGRVTNFLMNDKCAAGTGRYLELISSALDVPIENIGYLSLEQKGESVRIESYCAVFAQMDTLIMLREGRHINDILSGVCEAISKRVLQFLKRIKVRPALSISGGIAKNVGVVQRIEEELGIKSRIAFESQIVGALGAALFAEELFFKKFNKPEE